MRRLTPPTMGTFLVSLVLIILALVAHYVPQVAAAVPLSGSFWTPVAAYIVLMLGVLVKGM
jgi:hypothetical protein